MIIDVRKVNGKSHFAEVARKFPNSERFACEVVEQYRDAGGDSQDHLTFIFGKENLIRMHQVYLNLKYNGRG